MTADQWFGAAIIAGAIVTIAVFRCESRLRREASPVVPLDDLLHEQDSAEVYDDAPERVGDDTLALFGDKDTVASVYLTHEQYTNVEVVRAYLRDMVIAHVAREEAESDALKYGMFDLLHDARTGGAQ